MPLPTPLIRQCQALSTTVGDVLSTLRVAQDLDAVDELGRTALHWAVHSKNAPVVSVLLGQGANPDQPDLRGNTPLHLVAWFGNARSDVAFDTVNALMTNLANPHRPNTMGDTPIQLATYLASSSMLNRMRVTLDLPHLMNGFLTRLTPGTRTFQVTRCLALGVNPNGRLRQEDVEMPWLSAAAAGRDPAIVRLLLGAGAQPDARDSRGRTALHHGAPGTLPVIDALVAAGSELDALDEDGRTPLWMAVNRDNAGAARHLLGLGANPLQQDLAGESPWALVERRAGDDPFYDGGAMRAILAPAMVAWERRIIADGLPPAPVTGPARRRL